MKEINIDRSNTAPAAINMVIVDSEKLTSNI